MSRLRFYISIILIMLLGLLLALYKNRVLGFPFLPNNKEQITVIEARVRFYADDSPVKVSLFIPDYSKDYSVLQERFGFSEYGFSEETVEDGKRAVWSINHDKGYRNLYYRIKFLSLPDNSAKNLSFSPKENTVEAPAQPVFEGPMEEAVDFIITESKRASADKETLSDQIIKNFTKNSSSENLKLLKSSFRNKNEELIILQKILAKAGLSSKIVKGLFIHTGRRNQHLSKYIQVYNGKKWLTYNPFSGQKGFPKNFIPWQTGGKSLLDIEGGKKARITFSIIEESVKSTEVLKEKYTKNPPLLFDFSLHSLPVEEQNIFKVMFLIPIGTLIVVLLRIIIGIPTAGTFMPILIALAFRETSPLWGILLFFIIIGTGLWIRSYLSSMDLLLVPRIAAVVIVVILFMAFFSILSFKLGFIKVLTITYFPVVILAWTIERISIIWEENGKREALTQTAGTIVASLIIYLTINLNIVKHLTFTFPELLLIILGLIMLIGSYTGYRLTELRRFAHFFDKD